MDKWFAIRENMSYGKIIANMTVILNPFCSLYSDFVASSIKRWNYCPTPALKLGL